jgi:BASS family bile acid:Na+ symporter
MRIPPIALLNLFVVTVLLSIGLRVTATELLRIIQDRSLMLRSLLANCILVPAFGLLLVKVVPMSAETQIGILLLATIPGTPVALQFTRTASGRLAFAAGITFILSVFSVVITPLAVEILPQRAIHLETPLLYLVGSIFVYIAAPLFIGIWLSRRAPAAAPKLVKPLNVLATIIFLVLMLETRMLRAQARQAMSGTGISVILALLLFSMGVGWLLGGRDRETRLILATSTSMRSVVVCLYVARYCFPGTLVYVAPLAYLSLMVPINAVAVFGSHWLHRRAQMSRTKVASST